MKIGDLFSGKLESKLAIHLWNMKGQLFFPEIVWGIVRHYKTERREYFRAIVYAGTKNSLDTDREVWKGKKHISQIKSESELRRELVGASKRFNLDFQLREENKENPIMLNIKEIFKVNWLTETNVE